MVIVNGPQMLDDVRKRPDEELSLLDSIDDVSLTMILDPLLGLPHGACPMLTSRALPQVVQISWIFGHEFHTDPYHNIFCQVVGQKYVRLYPPEDTESVYPRGEDENGINESNTSSVEIKLDRRQANNVVVQDAESFPLFLAQTNYHEVVVGPGECLYIPAGWWHYIESLTPSSSVSFWWN